MPVTRALAGCQPCNARVSNNKAGEDGHFPVFRPLHFFRVIPRRLSVTASGIYNIYLEIRGRAARINPRLRISFLLVEEESSMERLCVRVKEACELLSIGRTSLYKSDIPYIKINGIRLYMKKGLDSYLDSHKVSPSGRRCGNA